MELTFLPLVPGCDKGNTCSPDGNLICLRLKLTVRISICELSQIFSKFELNFSHTYIKVIRGSSAQIELINS